MIPSSPIRILQVFGIMNRGGAENMIMNVYRAIDKKTIQFDFIVHGSEKGSFDDEIKMLGGHVYHCPRFSPSSFFSYKKWWKSFFKNNPQYLIIHSHIRSTASLFLKIAKRFGLKTIAHSHSTSNGSGFKAIVKRMLQYRINNYSDYRFACSMAAGKWLFGNRCSSDSHFFVVKNAIPIEDYSYNEEIRKKIRNELGLENNRVFIHVGRFHESKNHVFLIKFFKEIDKVQSNSKLLLVGDGELRKDVEKIVEENGLLSDVLFLGTRNDVSNLLLASDCFLFPSKWEGLPVTLIEAQASGLPCFVSNKVTNEVDVSNSIRFLSIEDGVGVWVDAIQSSVLTRHNNYDSLKSSGYDARVTANWLADFYLKLFYEKNVY